MKTSRRLVNKDSSLFLFRRGVWSTVELDENNKFKMRIRYNDFFAFSIIFTLYVSLTLHKLVSERSNIDIITENLIVFLPCSIFLCGYAQCRTISKLLQYCWTTFRLTVYCALDKIKKKVVTSLINLLQELTKLLTLWYLSGKLTTFLWVNKLIIILIYFKLTTVDSVSIYAKVMSLTYPFAIDNAYIYPPILLYETVDVYKRQTQWFHYSLYLQNDKFPCLHIPHFIKCIYFLNTQFCFVRGASLGLGEWLPQRFTHFAASSEDVFYKSKS